MIVVDGDDEENFCAKSFLFHGFFVDEWIEFFSAFLQGCR